MERISSYMYLVLMRLFSMEPKERQAYILNASDKFMKNKKYNSIRDEFDELACDSLYVHNNLRTLAQYAVID